MLSSQSQTWLTRPKWPGYCASVFDDRKTATRAGNASFRAIGVFSHGRYSYRSSHSIGMLTVEPFATVVGKLVMGRTPHSNSVACWVRSLTRLLVESSSHVTNLNWPPSAEDA